MEETDLHLGNILTTEGLNGNNMKDTEAALQLMVSKLWTQKDIYIYARSNATLNYKKSIMTKNEYTLKRKDIAKHHVDTNEEPREEYHILKH
eukprot:10072993-Ditylum_brightwellii.AAC.1